MQNVLDGATIGALRSLLIAFYDGAARALPWRETRDPYAIWISEVMSQQTRIDALLPYYERWIRRFPDVATLAAAEPDEVLKHWEGLGYYARARNLHAAAQIVCERHAGNVPVTYEALRALPGVGIYTAGAVSSIAGGEPRAAVDGNVRRVLARLFDLPRPTPPQLQRIAQELVPADRPGDFNQALMELGATTCTPRAPRCPRCPVAAHCAARRDGTQLERPAPRRRTALQTFELVTTVLADPAERLLLVRRTGGLLRGLWTFPAVELTAGSDAAAVAAALAGRYATVRSAPVALATVEHAFSHRRERYLTFLVTAGRSRRTPREARWCDEDLTNITLPRAQQRIRALALAELDRRSGR